jgi:hypothetical protein
MLVVEMTVFDPPEAKLKRKPYSVRVHTSDATAEQLVTGITLLGILADRMTKLANEKYPGAVQSFLRGDEVLKYGKGQVTSIEDAEGAVVAQEEREDEDATRERPTPRPVQGTSMDR